jgi:hypothetical protein
VTWGQKRAAKRLRRQLEADREVIWVDYMQSGKDLDDYREELEECGVLDLRGQWEPDGQDP